MPFRDGKLAGDKRRSVAVAILEDLEEMMAGIGVQRFQAPVIEDEQIDNALWKHSNRQNAPRSSALESDQLGEAHEPTRPLVNRVFRSDVSACRCDGLRFG